MKVYQSLSLFMLIAHYKEQVDKCCQINCYANVKCESMKCSLHGQIYFTTFFLRKCYD